jgi:serine phosphatase RsbU (regulator of sigma subunit)
VSEQPVGEQHLATLYEITRKLNSSLDLDEVLSYVMDRVIEVTGAERGLLMLHDDKTGGLDFRVARGIDQKDLDKPQFEISRTIVNKVAETGEPLLTDNAQDSFSEQESIVMKAMRSILCAPIVVRDEVIGLVYVDNRVFAGMFDQHHLELVTAFASQAGFAIENARLYQLAVEQGRLQRELEMAQNIQRGLLPLEFPVLPGYDVVVFWASATEVAGDFYDCFLLNEGAAMGVVIADVAGKGAPAAIFMAVARSLIRGNAIATMDAEHTLRQSNQLIISDTGDSGMFVTAYYAICKPGGEVLGVNGGHNQPLLWRAADDSIEWLPRGGRALGWFDDLPVETHHLQLQAGDLLLFYTDGLTEAQDLDYAEFGPERLAETVKVAARRPDLADIRDIIVQSIENFVGDAPPNDDRTFVLVRYTGEGE